jgi:nucleoporin POM152
LSYCLYDWFTPLDTSDGTIIFEGSPPFIVHLSIKSLVASHVDRKVIEVMDHVWKVDLPSYDFKSIGRHLLTIESVEDSSGCAHAVLDPADSKIWIDVSETAAIVPFDRREDYCVGDIVQFQLEGRPPWTVGFVLSLEEILKVY